MAGPFFFAVHPRAFRINLKMHFLILLLWLSATTFADDQMMLLNSALEDYRRGDCENSITTIDLANAIKPRADALLLKGMCLLRLGEPKRAHYVFRRVLTLPATPTIRNNAHVFIRQIRENVWERQRNYSLDLDISVGNNSNIFASDLDDSRPFAQLYAAAGYRFWQREESSWRGLYEFSHYEVKDFPQVQSQSHSAELNINWDLRTKFLQATPFFTYQTLGGDPFTTQVGARLRSSINLVHSSYALFEYSIGHVSPQRAIYDYQEGVLQQARAGWLLVKRNLDWNASLLVSEDNIGDLELDTGTLPLANRSYGPSLKLSWYPNSIWEATLAVNYLFRDFKRKTDDQQVRSDRLIYSNAMVSRRIGRTTAGYLSLAHIDQHSTLGMDSVQNKNYQQWIVTAGVNWGVFQ